jgi:hypothetical protein
MRTLLAALLVCSLGAPMASALPIAATNGVSAPKSAIVVHVTKRAPRARAPRQSRGGGGGGGGIHPLVGSGDY